MKAAATTLAVAALLAAAGCGGDPGPAAEPAAQAPPATTATTDTADWYGACTSFAEYIQAGQPGTGSAVDDERTNAVRDVSGLLEDYPDEALQDGRDGLVSALNTTEGEWATAADEFAQACFDAGWDG